ARTEDHGARSTAAATERRARHGELVSGLERDGGRRSGTGPTRRLCADHGPGPGGGEARRAELPLARVPDRQDALARVAGPARRDRPGAKRIEAAAGCVEEGGCRGSSR